MIKCKHCGASLEMDKPFCGYCGKPNDYFVQHREEMSAYQEEFAETKETVYAHTQKFTKFTVAIAVISVLVMLNIGGLVLNTQVYRISRWIDGCSIKLNLAQHQQRLNQLEEAEDFVTLYYYYSENSLYYSEDLEEYDTVLDVAWNYTNVYETLMTLYKNENISQRSYDNNIEYLAMSIEQIYEELEPKEYDDMDEYAPVHLAAMTAAEQQMVVLLKAYTAVPHEVLENLEELSYAQLLNYLEEGIDCEIVD